MATITQEEIDARNANLDALATAAKEWAEKEVIRIENETKFLRSVLVGRGADGAAVLNLLEGAAELGDEIDRFLVAGR